MKLPFSLVRHGHSRTRTTGQLQGDIPIQSLLKNFNIFIQHFRDFLTKKKKKKEKKFHCVHSITENMWLCKEITTAVPTKNINKIKI